MSYQQPLQTIEPDEASVTVTGTISGGAAKPTRAPVVLTPTNNAATATASGSSGDLESGLASVFRQSSHPLALFCLYLFRVAAISIYVLCGFFTDNYVLSTVFVVVLLAMDFWNCRNVAGRTLVGLRFWNQVDEDGESYWVFESRDPARGPPNPIDSKMFWIALYTFPVLWILLLIVSLLKFSVSFLPIVGLAIVFNVTNVIGFTYADRDAKQRWANAAGGWSAGISGMGGQILGGMVKNSVSRLFS